MDSHELIGRSGGNRWIPLVAVVQDDLRQIVRHWAYLIWAGLALVLPVLWLMNASELTAGSVANLLRQFGTAHEVAKQPPESAVGGLAASPSGPSDESSGTHVVRRQDGNYTPFEQDASAQQRSRDLGARPTYREDDRPAYASGRYSSAGSPSAATASQLGAKLLGMHLLVWIGLAMALGASAISSEFTSVGESVLCWGVSRWQYFVGKLAARAIAAMVLIISLTLPMLLVFNAKAAADLTFWPSILTTFWCACIVGCVAAAGVSVGVWFGTSMRAVGVSLVSLFVVGAVCTFLAPAAYSPMALVGNIPAALRGAEAGLASSVLSLAAWGSGGLAVVSMGKFMWADL